MTTPLNTAKFGLLLPAVLNPATAAAVGIGLGLLWLLRDDDANEATVDAVPIKETKLAVRTVVAPLPAVEMQTDEVGPEVVETAPAPISEVDQNEMIRSAMSELGKRSAAARAKKKAEQQDQGAIW